MGGQAGRGPFCWGEAWAPRLAQFFTTGPSRLSFHISDMEGVCWWGVTEARALFPGAQRLAYGVTPENEHHLVAQHDVRQFQVSPKPSCVYGVVGWGILLTFSLLCPEEHPRKPLGCRVEGEACPHPFPRTSLLPNVPKVSFNPAEDGIGPSYLMASASIPAP